MPEVNIDDEFDRCANKLSLSDDTIDRIKEVVETFNFVATPDSARKVYDCSSFSIWNLRIPSPESRKGKSGGYRLLFFYLKHDDLAYLYWIEKRTNLQKPKQKARYDSILKQLRKDLEKGYGE